MARALLLFQIIFVGAFVCAQTKNPLDDGRKIRIPVVFHVVYSTSEENIPDAEISKAIQDLNLNFSAQNDMTDLDQEFKYLVGNANIEFYLVDNIFHKDSLNGVQRLEKVKRMDFTGLLINPETCLNIFVGNHGNSSDILSDRVNLNYKDVGNHKQGLTHEVGHWLGLYHIFGQAGSSYFWSRWFNSIDDLIDDTPEQSKATYVKYDRICPPPVKLKYKGHTKMYNNFMDYNGCRCMFSVKQCIKMRNNIIAHKSALFND